MRFKQVQKSISCYTMQVAYIKTPCRGGVLKAVYSPDNLRLIGFELELSDGKFYAPLKYSPSLTLYIYPTEAIEAALSVMRQKER